MSKITDNFEKILREKNLPLTKKEIENGQVLYNGAFRVTKSKRLPFGIVFDGRDNPTVDFQIIYNRLAYIQSFEQKAEVMELLNELNEMKSGYYRFCVRGDGEIYMRLLARTSEDVRSAYEMMVMGGNIARALLPEIEKITGTPDSNNA